MYFPYLRGRQYELIAIRELVTQGRLSDKVIPIIEPVKMTSTFTSLIEAFEKCKHQLAIIMNPQVGDLSINAKGNKYSDGVNKLIDLTKSQSYIIKTMLSNGSSERIYQDFIAAGIDLSDGMAIYLDRDYIDLFNTLFHGNVAYTVVPYEPAFRRIRGKRIMITDRFAQIKKERNADYAERVDEFFSDDHLYYSPDFFGYSDYSIIGQNYQETGFAPYAVAIHIVYFDQEKNLRVHHFVSDSNDDINDPAGKFGEAVSKLVTWNQEMRLSTNAIQTFEQLHSSGAYPGLGVVKKLSLMHHLELMGQFFKEG